MSVFCLRQNKGASPVLEFNDPGDTRRDVDISWDREVTVIVMGDPHWLEDPGWVSANDILRQYEKRGASFIDRLDGFFSVIIQDKGAGKIFAAVDRYGVYAMFISRSADRLILSDSVEEICRHLPQVNLDLASIVEFVEFAHLLGNKTHFKEITKTPQSTILEIADDLSVGEREYWSIFGDDNVYPDPVGDVIELFNQHIGRGMDLAQNALLPLSGGLDSRAVLAACLPYKDRLRCYTFGIPNCRDIKLASRICEELSIPHATYLLDEYIGERIPEYTDRFMGWCNGMLNSVLLSFQDEYFRREAPASDLLLTGLGGELFRLFFTGRANRDLTVSDLAKMVGKKSQVNNVPGIFSVDFREEASRLLLSSLDSEIGKAMDPDIVTHSEKHYFRSRVTNFSAYTLAIASRYLPHWNTLLYSPILDRLRSIDPVLKERDLVERRIIEHDSGFLAGLVLDTGRIVTEGHQGPGLLLQSLRYKGFDFSGKVLRKAIKETTRRKTIPRHAMFGFAGLLARSQADYVRENLRYDDMVLRDLIDRETLERATGELLNGSNSVCYTLTGIMSLELWLKRIGEITTVKM